jgi:hypothetical protein
MNLGKWSSHLFASIKLETVERRGRPSLSEINVGVLAIADSELPRIW